MRLKKIFLNFFLGIIKLQLILFQKRILEKLKTNKNKWTATFRMKYNIYATTDYNELENRNTNSLQHE